LNPAVSGATALFGCGQRPRKVVPKLFYLKDPRQIADYLDELRAAGVPESA